MATAIQAFGVPGPFPREHSQNHRDAPRKAIGRLTPQEVEWSRARYREAVQDLAIFMSDLTRRLGRSERRLAAMQYVGGLLMPGRRKRIRSLAEVLGVEHQSLQQFLTNSPWSDEAMWSGIRGWLGRQSGAWDLWILNLRAWSKQGSHSVGVSYQSSGPHTKKTNCQVSAELLLGRGALAAPVASRLYLPEAWSMNHHQRKRSGVPADIENESWPDLAVRLLLTTLRDGVPKAPCVADRTFGDDTNFRLSLRALGFEYFLEIDPTRHSGWIPGVSVERAQTLDQLIKKLPQRDWEYRFYPEGERRNAQCLWQRILVNEKGRPPEPCWLVADWPKGSESCYRTYLAHLHRTPCEATSSSFFRSPACIRSHEHCFQDTLDLGSYQGRTWMGFHHHLVLAAAACVFVFIKNQGCFDAGGLEHCDPLIAAEAQRVGMFI
jgi:SRSO17 transposase